MWININYSNSAGLIILSHYQRAMYTKDRNAAVYDDLIPQNGYVDIPDRPGIGQELKPEIIKQSLIETID